MKRWQVQDKSPGHKIKKTFELYMYIDFHARKWTVLAFVDDNPSYQTTDSGVNILADYGLGGLKQTTDSRDQKYLQTTDSGVKTLICTTDAGSWI